MKIFDWVIKDNISPGEEFYYKIKEPESMNPSAFGSKIAYYDKSNQLLYHNKKAFAHELHDPVAIEESRAIGMGLIPPREKTWEETRLRMATWSKQGNMAYILEYIKLEYTYYNVFLNLKEQYQIRTIDAVSRGQEYISIPAEVITNLGVCRPNFDETEVLGKLEELGLRKEEPLINDPVNTNLLTEVLPKNKWHK